MAEVIIEQAVRDKIDYWVSKFPQGKAQSALLMGLREIQNRYGWLKDEHLDWLAQYLGVPELKVYEVVTFYSMYHREPQAKFVIKVCHSISCYLCGSGPLIKTFEKVLNIKLGDCTDDGWFALKEAECLANCCQGPVLLINDEQWHEKVSPNQVQSLIEQLKQSWVSSRGDT